MVIIIIILILVILVLSFLIWRIRDTKKILEVRVHKEAHEADLILREAFNSLRASVKTQIKILEKVRTKRQFTEEEDKIIKQLRKDLDDAEKFVRKEIEDIEKEIK